MTVRAIAVSISLMTLTASGATAVADASSSSAAPALHVRMLRFVDKQAGKAIDQGPLLIQADDDYAGKKLIGTDEINCTFGKTTASCLVTLSIKGGFLYGRFTESPSDAITGKITGGAGAFKGARGTISSEAHKPITVTYSV